MFASYEYQKRAVTAIPKTGFASMDVPASNDISRHYTTRPCRYAVGPEPSAVRALVAVQLGADQRGRRRA